MLCVTSGGPSSANQPRHPECAYHRFASVLLMDDIRLVSAASNKFVILSVLTRAACRSISDMTRGWCGCFLYPPGDKRVSVKIRETPLCLSTEGRQRSRRLSEDQSDGGRENVRGLHG